MRSTKRTQRNWAGEREREKKKSKTQNRWAMHAWNMKLMILYNYIAINWSSIHYFHSSWKLAQMSVGRSITITQTLFQRVYIYIYVYKSYQCAYEMRKLQTKLKSTHTPKINAEPRVTHTNSAHTKGHRKLL